VFENGRLVQETILALEDVATACGESRTGYELLLNDSPFEIARRLRAGKSDL
jgi:hypothetical protein